MIYINGKSITSWMLNGKAVQSIYRNGRLVWQALVAITCYGFGRWYDDKPWLDDDAWKDEP